MSKSRYICFVPLLLLFFVWTVSLASAQQPLESQATGETVDDPAFEGKRLNKLSFSTPLNLSFEDLSRSLPLVVGQEFTTERLEQSVFMLQSRKVFEQVAPEVYKLDDGVAVRFVLTPVLFVHAVTFTGNELKESRDLARLTGIRPGDRFDPDKLPTAEERIREGYRRQGSYLAQVKVRLSKIDAADIDIVFDITENYQSRLTAVVFVRELPENLSFLKDYVKEFVSSNFSASEENVKRLRRELLSRLRSHGYLQASVDIEKQTYLELTGDVEVEVEVTERKPMSLEFIGNKNIHSNQLIALLKLETRIVPFSPNALLGFCEEIKQLYQSHGCYFAEVTAKEKDGTGESRIYQINIVEGEKFRVRNVSFEGNTSFRDSKLSSLITTKPAGFWPTKRWQPGYLVQSQLDDDAAAIADFYRQHGFSEVAVQSNLNVDQEDQLIDVTFKITESERKLVREVNVRWNSETEVFLPNMATAPALPSATILKPETPYDEELLENQRAKLQQEMFKQGYPLADVDAERDPEAGQVNYVIHPGKQIRIGKVWIEGNNYTHDHVILGELSFAEGKLWDPTEIESSEHSLYSLGFFRNVSIRPRDNSLDQNVEDIVVHVNERDTGSIDTTASFTTEEGLHLAGEVGQRNINGNGSALILGVDGFFRATGNVLDSGGVRAAYARPHFMDTKADLILESFLQSSVQLTDQFSYDREGGAASLRYRVAESLRGSLGIRAFNERVYDVPKEAILGPLDQGSAIYSILEPTLEWDRRDNAYNPREGYQTLVTTQFAAKPLGSDSSFWGASVEQSVFVPLSTRLVWANGVRGAYLDPFDGTSVIPLAQRIFLGGRGSLRGYSPSSIGPRAPDDEVVGGDSSVNFSTELRYEFLENIELVTFLDLGQAFLLNKGETINQPENESVVLSPGFGIHYKTPIGPVSVEVGFALERDHGERWGRINIGIGSAF